MRTQPSGSTTGQSKINSCHKLPTTDVVVHHREVEHLLPSQIRLKFLFTNHHQPNLTQTSTTWNPWDRCSSAHWRIRGDDKGKFTLGIWCFSLTIAPKIIAHEPDEISFRLLMNCVLSRREKNTPAPAICFNWTWQLADCCLKPWNLSSWGWAASTFSSIADFIDPNPTHPGKLKNLLQYKIKHNYQEWLRWSLLRLLAKAGWGSLLKIPSSPIFNQLRTQYHRETYSNIQKSLLPSDFNRVLTLTLLWALPLRNT